MTMATLVRWDPFREIAALQNELSRFAGAFRDTDGSSSDRTWAPALDVWETENEVVYSFDLPGIPEDRITVEFENGVLAVSAERERGSEVKQDGFYRYERRVGSFARTISLPEGVTEDGVKASYANGVLEVRVQKPEEAKPRRIEIGVNGSKTIEGTATEA
jgi:HSP20 family protein